MGKVWVHTEAAWYQWLMHSFWWIMSTKSLGISIIMLSCRVVLSFSCLCCELWTSVKEHGWFGRMVALRNLRDTFWICYRLLWRWEAIPPEAAGVFDGMCITSVFLRRLQSNPLWHAVIFSHRFCWSTKPLCLYETRMESKRLMFSVSCSPDRHQIKPLLTLAWPMAVFWGHHQDLCSEIESQRSLLWLHIHAQTQEGKRRDAESDWLNFDTACQSRHFIQLDPPPTRTHPGFNIGNINLLHFTL